MKLKPCDCGCCANIIPHDVSYLKSNQGNTVYEIRCNNGCASVHYFKRNKAIEAWNTRKEEG